MQLQITAQFTADSPQQKAGAMVLMDGNSQEMRHARHGNQKWRYLAHKRPWRGVCV